MINSFSKGEGMGWKIVKMINFIQYFYELPFSLDVMLQWYKMMQMILMKINNDVMNMQASDPKFIYSQLLKPVDPYISSSLNWIIIG